MNDLASSQTWRTALSRREAVTLSELFTVSPDRSLGMQVTCADLLIDYSRQLVDDLTMDLLVAAADECRVEDRLSEMFAGESINVSENRSVGHVALRMHRDENFPVAGRNVVPDVHANLEAMADFAEGIRSGRYTGSTGKRITTVVNIGIGGSDLGPVLLDEALWSLHHENIRCVFVSNVDPADLDFHLSGLVPEETVVIVASKTFTTSETLANAEVAVGWIHSALGDRGVERHVVAVSADPRAVASSGLGISTVFSMWDWIGGRFSIASAVGLAAMIAVGAEAFGDFLEGMHDVDVHVRSTRGRDNGPLVLALLAIWNRTALGHSTRAVIPYAFGLRKLPAYLQQLVMESNGKGIGRDGSPIEMPTSAVIWGDAGTNAQHAFMQLLHQGTEVVPVDFIGFATTVAGSSNPRHKVLFMNMVAQAQALAFGRAADSREPHRHFPGNRPSTVIVSRELSPRTLGQIIALYEHAVFFEGVLLGINSFDQWGVELGKEMATTLLASPSQVDASESISATAARRLVAWFESATAQT